MTKYQALQNFWSSFGLPAYDTYSVPIDAKLPYLTYSTAIGGVDEQVFMSASIWYRSPTWSEADSKAIEIETRLGQNGITIPIDHGFLFLFRGTPFAQRLNDPSDARIKRIYFNIGAEFLTAH